MIRVLNNKAKKNRREKRGWTSLPLLAALIRGTLEIII